VSQLAKACRKLGQGGKTLGTSGGSPFRIQLNTVHPEAFFLGNWEEGNLPRRGNSPEQDVGLAPTGKDFSGRRRFGSGKRQQWCAVCGKESSGTGKLVLAARERNGSRKLGAVGSAEHDSVDSRAA
jgi:hypothetical protein